MDAAALLALRNQELSCPRHRDTQRLTHHGHKVFSQSDEDGIIAEIFRRIGTTNCTFIEFGVEAGLECNTMWLLMQGWSGGWIEGSTQCCDRIKVTHEHWLQHDSLKLINGFITAENINDLLASFAFDANIDLLSVDIDYNDFWVWKAIDIVRPRVVVVEYNATWAPPAAITVPYEPNKRWDGTNYYGASLAALSKLGDHKGYYLVGCCLTGVNAFFVRKDLCSGRFLRPGSVEEHYEPARYLLALIPSGHPSAVGPVVTLE